MFIQCFVIMEFKSHFLAAAALVIIGKLTYGLVVRALGRFLKGAGLNFATFIFFFLEIGIGNRKINYNFTNEDNFKLKLLL